LFNDQGEEAEVQLPEVTGYVWHGYLPDIQPGQRYGYRIFGPNDPNKGFWTNPAKLLLDPYAKAIEGSVKWEQAVFPYFHNDPEGPENTDDSAPFVPKCVVVNPFYNWQNDRPPGITLHESIIYETHVKGFTILRKDIPEEIRGTYLGIAHPIMIEYLKDLGITTLELMPGFEAEQMGCCRGKRINAALGDGP
jgi:glycogen operon protein